jgi:acyl-homoserine-lactone acylase
MNMLRAMSIPVAVLLLGAAPVPSPDLARWRAQAARVTIARDDWGLAHVHGKSDADAVFGAIYAQAEDDFPRIEANYLTALGRTAEADGEAAIWQDLRQRMWIDPAELRRTYAAAPGWLQTLCQAWADGLNFYLATHPQARPRVLTRFEPWMALSFTEGSIGGDIEQVDLKEIAAFYREPRAKIATTLPPDDEPRGSNGIAISPKLSANGRPLLLINPHTSFFFRSELEMRSDQGLHAYGASTWGQFFLYQGFNERLGWMHTTSGADAVDEFAEDVQLRPTGPVYRVGATWRPVERRSIALQYRRPDGTLARRDFDVWRTHHGPLVAKRGGRMIATALMHRPLQALQQSWLRTKARDQAGFLRVAALQANSSNNTVYADADGHTALLFPQFVPVRDVRFDYTKPVDGADPSADWRGITPLGELPQVRDPRDGWLYNTNDAPWRAAGADSPRRSAFPRYMDQFGANPRGDHATALLAQARALDWRGLRDIAYSPRLPAFERLVPRLAAARPDRAAPRLGRALVGRQHGDDAGECLGRGAVGARRRGHGRAAGGRHTLGPDGAAARRGAARRADGGRDPAADGLGRLARALGRGEPASAQRRRDRAAVRRRQAVRPRPVRERPLGQPRLLRRAALSRHEALVRDEREQLRRDRRVRPARARLVDHRRRRERQPALAALHGPGGAVRRGRAEAGLFLAGRVEGACATPLPAGRIA